MNMIAITNAAAFREGLDIAATAVQRHASLPVLSQVKVSANGALAFVGTDLDDAVEARVPYNGTELPEFLLPNPKELSKAIGAARAGEVELSMEQEDGGTFISTRAKDFVSRVKTGLPPGDFPATGYIQPTFRATFAPSVMETLRGILEAASTEDTRYYLNGVYLHHANDAWGYTAVATDGHRLYRASLELPDAEGVLSREDEKGIIIPRSTLERLVKMWDRLGRPDVSFASGYSVTNKPSVGLAALFDKDPNRSQFTLSSAGETAVIMTSRVVDGTFPDYHRVIPEETEHDVRVTVDANELVRGLRVLLAAGGRHHAETGCSLTFEPGGLILRRRFVELNGAASVTLPFEGKAVTSIAFNPKYLIRALQYLGGDHVSMRMPSAHDPCVMHSDAGTDRQAVVMPMRI